MTTTPSSMPTYNPYADNSAPVKIVEPTILLDSAGALLGASDNPMYVTVTNPSSGGGGGGTQIVSGTVAVSNFPATQVVSSVDLGTQADAAATADTGSFSLISAMKRLLAKFPALNTASRIPVASANFQQILRDNAQSNTTISTTTTTTWIQSVGGNDLILVEGNTLGAGYITISKDPLVDTTTTTLTTNATFTLPVEVDISVHTSQRTYGQELSVEFVSTDTYSVPADVAISSIQQTTTTLSVTTATAHGYHPGMRIGIRGVTQDSRLNYPSLVVATTPTTTTFTATAGPSGTITTMSVGPYTSGYVYLHDALGGANDGTALVFDNATATNGCFYVRTGGGPDELSMGGTLAGNHTVTIASTVSAQPIASALTYAFQPTSEYRMIAQEDRVSWVDVASDTLTSQPTVRVGKTQVVPDPSKRYALRLRAVNLPSFTTVTGQIQSATKSGSTTATLVVPSHGLTTGDWIVAYGVRDTTNFANLTSATQVASVIDTNTITVVWGSAVTATSYGGFYSRVRGQQVLQGVSTIVAQSISRTANIVSVVGSATWTGFTQGDFVNLVGCRDQVTGASIGLDGPYRVRDIQTTTVVLEPIGNTPTGADVSSTNCGGGIVKRTDLRLSAVRILDYERLRIESAQRGGGDAQGGIPVVIQANNAVLSTNISQLGGTSSASSIANGSTNKGLGTTQMTAVSNTDQSATAFAGSGSVVGTMVASAQGGGGVVTSEINVSTLTLGTATAVFAILQESRGGANFSDIWTSPPITASGIISMPPIPVAGRRRWRFFSAGGTSTTVTVTITTLELPTGTYPLIRQGFDYYAATNPLSSMYNNVALTASSLVSTTLNSTSTPIYIESTKQLTAFLVVTGGTPTTNPVYTLQLSPDGTNWFSTTTTLTPTTAGTFMVNTSGYAMRFARFIVSTASSGGTAYTVAQIGIMAV